MKTIDKKNRKIIVILFAVFAFALFSCNNDVSSITPSPSETGTWKDERDGNEYGWVKYGDLEWTTSNMRFHSGIGTVMPDTTSVTQGLYDDGIAAKYFKTFGFLYDFEAAQAAVPEGWRLPTVEDWQELEQITHGDVASAINLSLGGYYLIDTYFQQLHKLDYYTYVYGFYWTSTIDNTKAADNFAFYNKITYNSKDIECNSMIKSNYLSVRLVRDAK